MNFTQKLVTKAVGGKRTHEQDEGRGREAKGGGKRKEIKKQPLFLGDSYFLI